MLQIVSKLNNRDATNLDPIHVSIKWKKPPPKFFKVNCNFTCDQRKQKLCLGALIRNSEGMVVGLLQATRGFNDNPFTVEALALLLATQFCKETGITQIIVEGDAL